MTYLIVEDNTAAHEQLSKVYNVNATFLEYMKVNARLLQKFNGILGIEVFLQVKAPEVELPNAIFVVYFW